MWIYTEGTYVKTQEEDCCLQGEERGLIRNQIADTLSSEFRPPEMGENSYLSHSVYGALLYQPQKMNRKLQ